MFLMLLGNAGIVAAAGTLIIGFRNGGAGPAWGKIAELILGLFALLHVSRSRWVDRRLTALVSYALRRYTSVSAGAQSELVALPDGHLVLERAVQSEDPIVDQTVKDLRDEGVAILGIGHAGGRYESTPPGATVIQAGDTLFLYGPATALTAATPTKARFCKSHNGPIS